MNVFIAIDKEDGDPVCIAGTLDDLIVKLDDFCGYPEGATREPFVYYKDLPSEVPYVGSLLYHNKGDKLLVAWDTKFEIYKFTL